MQWNMEDVAGAACDAGCSHSLAKQLIVTQ